MTPSTLGLPCWTGDRIATVITNIAKMDASRAHYFLATHSPIHGIRNERTNAAVTEEQLFEALCKDRRDESLAVIHGEPGTGKSHLVHWLKLRFEHGVETGEVERLVPVLIQRRTGSLKDALDQIIRQLPQEFGHYLEPVRQALGKLTKETARATLAAQLALELGERWAMREHAPVPPKYRHAAELCRSQGFREWLCRDDGALARNVQRLIAPSGVEDRDALPPFDADEFRRIGAAQRIQNTPAVRDLIDEIDEFDDVPQDLARLFNQALPDAIREMSGLGQGTLADIFENIRRDLHRQNKGLAVFIEDVSVMSELDHEVFRAVEPRSRPELGRLIAVLGMTHTGKARLRQNELERVTHLVSVSAAVDAWRDSPDDVGRFVARYLNALRLDEERVRSIAVRLREGQDAPTSNCANCPVQDACHKTFGAIEIGEVPIGMFPLTRQAAHRLLSSLDTQIGGVRKNPRGLLDHVLRPLLADTEAFEAGNFPRPTALPVRLSEPVNWTAFTERYCGNWSENDRARLKFLVQAWIDDGTDEQKAVRLAPFLTPLGLPAFTTRLKTPAAKQPEKSSPQVTSPPSPAVPPTVPTLQRILDDLAAWLERKQELINDARPREMVLALIKGSFPIDDIRGLPRAVFNAVFADKAVIRFEGQRSQPANQKVFLDLPRTTETRGLVEALAHYEHLGQKSWSFPKGEMHKRVVSRWLRSHQSDIVCVCFPSNLDPRAPARVAAQVLVLAATLRRRRPLRIEDGYTTLVQEAIAEFKRPVSLTTKGVWSDLLSDLEARHAGVRQLALEELAVTQGTGGVNFIDPLPFVEATRELAAAWNITPLPAGHHSGFWQSRNVPLARLDAFSDLATALAPERALLSSTVRSLRALLDESGYAGRPTTDAIKEYVADLREIEQHLKKNKLPVPDEEFDRRKQKDLYDRTAALANAVAAAEQVVGTEGIDVMLGFDAESFARARDALDLAVRYAAKVANEIERATKVATADGDPVVLHHQLLAALDAITAPANGAAPADVLEAVEP